MLTQLRINNFAIVRKLNIDLSAGMSVITGETGAGKSIAIDALGLCLGQRAEPSMVRETQERAEVCAVFQLEPQTLAMQWLQAQELQDEDNPTQCILRRIITKDGRSKAFINSTPVTIAQLKELGQYLIHINGQHASQLLLKADYQLKTLDTFCNHSHLLTQMAESYKQWKKLNQALDNFQNQCAENEARRQLLQYQLQELDEFALQEQEFTDLDEEQKRLANSEQLTQLSQSVLQLLSKNETMSIDSLLYRATQQLDELTELDTRYQSVHQLLQEALYQVQEAVHDVTSYSADIEDDPQRLEYIDQRLGQAISLARKHNVKPQDLFLHHQTLRAELDNLTDFQEGEEELKQQLITAQEKMHEIATALHQSRCQGAEKLAQSVTKSIKQLAMENALFFVDVAVDYSKISALGANSVIFNLQSNLGQSAQPLIKVASGGELSRIALTLQVLTFDQQAVPTLIFDEIDVGISGATASIVGKLLRKLGSKCQVLCVTHLPQVAAQGHQHFMVEKQTVENQTETQMITLTQQQRVKALAKLLGGSSITQTALANAQELLALAS